MWLDWGPVIITEALSSLILEEIAGIPWIEALFRARPKPIAQSKI